MSSWPSSDDETLTVNQADLANIFDVDRSTVRKWQNEGLPYQPGPKRERRFVVPLAMHWFIGRDIANSAKFDVSNPIVMYCLGWIHGANLNPEITSLAMLKQDAKRAKISKHFDCPTDEFNYYFAIALGLYMSKYNTRWII